MKPTTGDTGATGFCKKTPATYLAVISATFSGRCTSTQAFNTFSYLANVFFYLYVRNHATPTMWEFVFLSLCE